MRESALLRVPSFPHACVGSFGTFETELEAAVAYDKMARERGPAYPLNWPDRNVEQLEAMLAKAKVRGPRLRDSRLPWPVAVHSLVQP